ncbi:MAG: hypothetical protein CBB70_11645 [Planctomycetaceae bacterium TMED10]|nr:MAG: hypothetical protein CBB70_11645 [Planctomycetaceae bacterium TMED10]
MFKNGHDQTSCTVICLALHLLNLGAPKQGPQRTAFRRRIVQSELKSAISIAPPFHYPEIQLAGPPLGISEAIWPPHFPPKPPEDHRWPHINASWLQEALDFWVRFCASEW